MTLFGFIFLLIIAAFAGALGQGLAGYSLGGCLASLIVGFVGAFIGLWLARFFGLPIIFPIAIQGQSFPLVWAVIGSALLAGVLGLFSRRRRFS